MKMHNCCDQAQLWQGNENMQNMCQRLVNRLYAPIVSLNNIHQCGTVVLKFQCYFCHSSVVCSLCAPRTLNNHHILKPVSVILFVHFNVSCMWCLHYQVHSALFSSHSTGEFVLKIPSILLSKCDCVLPSCKTIQYQSFII